MEITTKELRLQPGRIIDQAANGIEIIVTYRGKPLVKIIPIRSKSKSSKDEKVSIFGLWKEHRDIKDVEEHIRDIRKERKF